MKQRTILSIFSSITLTAFLGVFAPTEASIIGDEVQGTLNFDTVTGNYFDLNLDTTPVTTNVVDPGVEFTTFISGDVLQVQANLSEGGLLITLRNNTASSFNLSGFTIDLEDLDFVDAPGGIEDVVPDGGNTLLENSLAFGLNNIALGFAGGPLGPNETRTAQYDIQTTPVPEPGTLLVLGSMIGFAFFAASRRKQPTTTNNQS